ncbi:putative mitochondrial protein, partial [Mucuna pruriens]
MEIPLGFYSHNEKNKRLYIPNKVLYLPKEENWDARPQKLPIAQNHRIGSEESPTIEKSQYQRLVRKLIYLSHTRPDIAYAVSVISQFIHDPKESFMQLKGSSNYGGSVVDRRSSFGYCMKSGNMESKKQKVVSRSSVEAEFQAITHGICEGLWIKIILDSK